MLNLSNKPRAVHRSIRLHLLNMETLRGEIKPNVIPKNVYQEEFVKRYNVFLEKSHQNKRELENLRCLLPSVIQTLHIPTHVCSVLSVGSGNGDVDLEVLKIIREASQKKVYCRAIEPCEYFLNMYKKTLEHLEHIDGTKVDVNEPKTFREYMAEPKTERGLFDVVHFIHSIYYMDFEEALTHCYEKELGERGIIMCVAAFDDDIVHETKRNVSKLTSNGNILQVIENKGWKYQEYKDEYLLDVTEIINDQQSETGNFLLDFFTHTINFRNTVNQPKVKEILDLIADLSIDKDRKRFCKKVDNYTFIFK